MKRKFVIFLMVFALAATFAACGEEQETTLTGMVVSVEGTVISLVEMDAGQMGGGDFAQGQRPEMPEGMEGFDPSKFDGTMPEGSTFPQWEEGEMPEGMTPPEGMPMPEGGGRPEFGGDMGGMGSGFGNFAENLETKDIDITGAHISVEIDGGKATGSMDDIREGIFVTITMNSKGEVTNVLVSGMGGFGGGWPAGGYNK